MAKNSQVNIRFDDATDALLESTAAGIGISKSALVRHLTGTFLDEVQRTGSIKLRPDWIRMLGSADARSVGGERKLPTQAMLKDEKAVAPQPTVKPTTNPKGRKGK